MPFLIQIVVALAIVGLSLWVVQQVPMDPAIAKIIRVVVIVITCLWLLSYVLPLLNTGAAPVLPMYPRAR